MNEDILLTREVDAIQIPSGDSITLPMGTPVVVTQTLGGTYTVATSSGLARISSQDGFHQDQYDLMKPHVKH